MGFFGWLVGWLASCWLQGFGFFSQKFKYVEFMMLQKCGASFCFTKTDDEFCRARTIFRVTWYAPCTQQGIKLCHLILKTLEGFKGGKSDLDRLTN